MMNLFKIILIAVAILSLSNHVSAAEISGTGFISDTVWLSEEDLVIGESVSIYTAIFNNSSSALEGSVTFFDEDVVLGVKTFSIPENSVRDVRQSWIVTSGSHGLYANLSVKNSSIELGIKETIPFDFKVAAPLVPEKEPLSKETEDILSGVENLENKIVESIPVSVSEKITESFSGVEDFRNETALDIDNKKEEKQTTLEEIKSAGDSNSIDLELQLEKDSTNINMKSSPLDTPFAYAGVFFYTVLSYIFNSKILFYGLCAVILFLILRGVYRAIRRRS